MKYRILSTEELSYLDEDLKHFLIVNGVHGEEWERLNSEETEKAISLVELFSDTVLQKVYEKISYLEFRSPESCMVFHCLPDKMELIAIQRKSVSSVDLSTPESIHHALTQAVSELEFFKSEKSYSMNRELEIHTMTEQGCVISSAEFWGQLKQVIG